MGRIAGFKNKFNLIIRNTCLTKCNDFRFALAFIFHFFSSICSKQARTCCMNAIMDRPCDPQADRHTKSVCRLFDHRQSVQMVRNFNTFPYSVHPAIHPSYVVTCGHCHLYLCRVFATIYIRQYKMQL